MTIPYARLLQLIRVTGEAEKEERRWEAMWSYRAQPPTTGQGKARQSVPFSQFLAQLGLSEPVEVLATEVSDEEIDRLFKQGRMGLFPPGM